MAGKGKGRAVGLRAVKSKRPPTVRNGLEKDQALPSPTLPPSLKVPKFTSIQLPTRPATQPASFALHCTALRCAAAVQLRVCLRIKNVHATSPGKTCPIPMIRPFPCPFSSSWSFSCCYNFSLSTLQVLPSSVRS